MASHHPPALASDGSPVDRAVRYPEEVRFPEYLQWVRANPTLAENAHQRLWRMIVHEGMEDSEGHPYPFFTQHLYGIDGSIRRLVDEYFRPAAAGFDVRRRILLLVGPVGGGKSTIVTLMKRGLEKFSQRPAGALYRIVGCPMHEEPMHLLDPEERLRLAQGWGLTTAVEGALCPLCQWRLDHEFGGRPDLFQVARVELSELHRMGIGTYAPSDPKSQDIAELTGSIDFQRIAEVGSESDPRAFRFDGELNIANRGLVEFQEMLKLDERFLYHLLSLSQEGNFKTGRYQLISADEVIVGHTNEYEYRAFKKNPKNQALLSRMIVIPVGYNLDMSQEMRIYEKMLGPYRPIHQHVSKRALETAATVAIISRIGDQAAPREDRMASFKKLRQGMPADGMVSANAGFEGLDPRYVINRLGQLMAQDRECVDGVDVVRGLVEGVQQDPFCDPARQNQVEEWAGLAEAIWLEEVEEEVRRAFVAEGEEALRALRQNYWDALCKAVENGGGDERLLRSVELRLDVAETQKHQFREEVYVGFQSADNGDQAAAMLSGTAVGQALERKLFDDLRDAMRLSSPDRETMGWIERAAERMVADGRYCPCCATKAIRRLGTVLGR